MSFQTGIGTHLADEACVVCLMRPYLWVGISTGMVGYSYSCPHLNKSVTSASFHHSPVTLITFLALAAGSVIYTSYNTWYIIHHESEWYRLPFLIYQIHACPIQLQRFWVLDGNIKEYTGLTALIENCQLYGVERVYDKKAVKEFNLHKTLVVTSLVCTLAFDTICRVIIQGVNLWVIFTQLIETVQIAQQLIMATSYIATFRIYTQLKQVCYRHMKQCLNGRIANVTEDIIEEHSISLKGVQNHESTITKLQKLQRMHLAIMTNFEETVDVLSLAIFLVTSSYGMILVVALYNFITHWWNGIVITLPAMYLFIEVCLILIFAPWALLTIKGMYNTSNDILDYLENFPINRLNANESAQVEAVIIAVRSIQPTITACGLFDMDISVYCSILVVVISYFLLALQFQAAWVDE